jgi:hypothetical protein
MFIFLLFACSNSEPGDSTSKGDDSAASGTDDTGPACTPLNSADDWAWHGECPQMTTPCAIEVDGCALTIDYGDGGMTMGMPYAATVSGDTVTFDDGDSVTGCTGTITDTDKVEGTCDGGCTFTLRR